MPSNANLSPNMDEPASREARRPVTLPAYALLEDDSTFSVTVIDLSYDGCKIETPFELPEGTALKLSVLQLGALDARVRWHAEGVAGLSFKPNAEPEHKPRNHPRIALGADLSLRRAGRHQYRARVFDLSPSGCKVEFVERPRTEERLWVKFDGLETIEGEVCWVDGFHGGVRFVTPIHPAVFDMLLESLGRR